MPVNHCTRQAATVKLVRGMVQAGLVVAVKLVTLTFTITNYAVPEMITFLGTVFSRSWDRWSHRLVQY